VGARSASRVEPRPERLIRNFQAFDLRVERLFGYDSSMFGQVREELSELAGRFDPALLDAPSAGRVLDDVVAIKNMAAAMEAPLLAREAETSIWRDGGARSAAEEFARRTGVRVRDAQAAIETGRRLRDLPATADAAMRGELSAQQTAAIADAASVDPHAEARLLAQAGKGSLQELRQACARTKANASDLEARRRRIHDSRHVRSWVDTEGVGHLHLRDNPERIAAVVSVIDARRDVLVREARAAGRSESLEAHAADALHELVCGEDQAAGAKPAAKILVRVDLDALLRGSPVGEETCEIAGYGPVAVSAVRDMIDTDDPFLVAIATKGEQVLGVAHLGRRVNAKQQSALEWLYPTCAVEGCSRSTFLENDHREDWARTKLTLLDWSDRVCDHHHDLKTHHGWALITGHGKRAFVPPDDTRHPRHHRHRVRAKGPPAAA
jgi:hypothetical protein